jgi:hypothetical protein
MPKFEDNEDTKIVGTIQPSLAVSWARHRAWHGETVGIRVRTTVVPDGSSVDLTIVPDGSETVFDTPAKQTIQSGSADLDYKVDWKEKSIPADTYKFVVKAKISALNLNAASEPLTVDLRKPLFSA